MNLELPRPRVANVQQLVLVANHKLIEHHPLSPAPPLTYGQVAVQPAHYHLRVVAGVYCDVRGAGPLCNVVEGKEALAAAGIRDSQGQGAQVRQRLTPAFMINS